jgi:hypothetical protein
MMEITWQGLWRDPPATQAQVGRPVGNRPELPDRHRTEFPDPTHVKELLRDERPVIFGTRHALAVYDIATDKHAWFVQLEGSRNVGFKYDRWDAIEGVSWSAPGVLALKVSSRLVTAERMRVRVPRP